MVFISWRLPDDPGGITCMTYSTFDFKVSAVRLLHLSMASTTAADIFGCDFLETFCTEGVGGSGEIGGGVFGRLNKTSSVDFSAETFCNQKHK